MRILAIAVCLFLLAMVVTGADAKPLAIASQGGVTITFTDEPCTLAAVRNLPNRATWSEGGKTFEGCFTVQELLVLAYFDDRTMVVIHSRHLRPAVEA